jgi:hypothetical protein
MNLNNLTIQERAEMEKFIAENLEKCLNRISQDREEVTKLDFDIAEIHMDFYYDHIHKYGSSNIIRYCNLKPVPITAGNAVVSTISVNPSLLTSTSLGL